MKSELDTAIYCEYHNHLQAEATRKREMENAYNTLKNMMGMLKENHNKDRTLPIPTFPNKMPSSEIQDRYDIIYQSEFAPIWTILEKVCKGELIQKS